jgi:TrkA domain protein
METTGGEEMDIQETTLPGVGVRHDFTTRGDRQLGVVSYRTGRLAELQQQLEGLAISWLTIHANSPYAGGTIADTQARSRTGVSIVAVLRGQTAFPAPEPSFGFQAGDTAVVVGTPAGVRTLTNLLDG